jgi:hypothetical protein
MGLDAAVAAFELDVQAGLTTNDSLAIVVGTVEKGVWNDLQGRLIGPDALQFVGNINEGTGKLATALRYETDSVNAYAVHGGQIPEGPQRYVGAVYYVARVETVEHGWMTRIFAGAASGVQGHFDQATTYSALTRMAALWALKMQALHGKP